MTPTTRVSISDEANSSLSKKTTSGFVWLAASSIGMKLVNMIGQIILARLLIPEDFGLIGLAYTVTAFAGLIQHAGIRDILIRRQSKFERWATPAFWMYLSLASLAGSIMIIAAPVAAHIFNSPKITWLIIILGISTPISALSAVPTVYLQIQLRFRVVATCWLWTGGGMMFLSILFAWLDFGAYSFVLSRLISALVQAVYLWNIAKPPIKLRLQWRRWKFLIRDSASLFGIGVLTTITQQADYFILGIFSSTVAVGLYFFAFNLSTQTTQILAQSLSNALLPALGTLQVDPLRQTRVSLQAARVLAMIGTPACFLQAALAGPIMRMLFNEKWWDAIPIFQILSVGMVFTIIATPAGSIMRAQGRFLHLLYWSALSAVVFVTLVSIGAMLGGPIRVAFTVTLFLALTGPCHLFIALRPGGATWKDIWSIHSIPIVVAALCISAPAFLARSLPVVIQNELLYLLFVTGVGSGLYLLFIRYLMPQDFDSLMARLRGMLAKGSSPTVET